MREVMGVVLTNMDYRIIFIRQQGFLSLWGSFRFQGDMKKP
jgi:hypothetical protein